MSGNSRSRREALKLGAGGLIWASIGGAWMQCSPQRAAAAQAPFQFFSAREGELLGAYADTLVPGAAAAGCAYFVDHHVSVPPADSLLSLRYFDVAPPYGEFYRSALAAAAKSLGNEMPRQWSRLPKDLFHFVVRSDAIDCVYCTVEGFKRLGVDYLAHIPPATDW